MRDLEISKLKEQIVSSIRQELLSDLGRPTETFNLTEAAKRYHKGYEAIRTAIRRKKIKGFKGGDGQWYVERQELDRYFGKSA